MVSWVTTSTQRVLSQSSILYLIAYFCQSAKGLELVSILNGFYEVKLGVVILNPHWASLRETSLTTQVWVYSSQALTKPSGLPDLLVGLADGRALRVQLSTRVQLCISIILSSVQSEFQRPLGIVNGMSQIFCRVLLIFILLKGAAPEKFSSSKTHIALTLNVLFSSDIKRFFF